MAPTDIEFFGKSCNLSVQLDEVYGDFFEFVECRHCFFLGEVLTEKMDEVAVLDAGL